MVHRDRGIILEDGLASITYFAPNSGITAVMNANLHFRWDMSYKKDIV